MVYLENYSSKIYAFGHHSQGKKVMLGNSLLYLSITIIAISPTTLGLSSFSINPDNVSSLEDHRIISNVVCFMLLFRKDKEA